MRKYTFNWEIQTMIEQFIGAFNDVVIKRYDKNKNITAPGNVNVSYLYAPKSRVIATLQNPAPGGVTVPVIAVTLGSLNRVQERVYNKHVGSYATTADNMIKPILQPVPVNIGVNMTILTKYQNDMDQILSNFIPYCDPYIVISWKVPNTEEGIPQEIRTEVLWSGSVNIQYPVDISGNQSYRITADTSFTIKGWLFKDMDEEVGKIYKIDSDYTPFLKNLLDEDSTESFSISARPQF